MSVTVLTGNALRQVLADRSSPPPDEPATLDAMRGLLVLLLLLFATSCTPPESGAAPAEQKTGNPVAAPPRWRTLPDLPNPVGVAGAFVGTSGDALIVAGGANFENGMPWDGGAKVFHQTTHVWDGRTWHTPTPGLPEPTAYGVSISTPGGVVCIGGQSGARCFAEVFVLTWDPATRSLRRTDWPPLPAPLSFAGGAAVTLPTGERFLYVVGGQQTLDGSPGNGVFRLRIRGDGRGGVRPDARDDGTEAVGTWETLPPCPGPRRGLPVVAARGAQLFVFSGRDYGPARGGESEFEFHTDWLRLDAVTGTWSAPRQIRLPGEEQPRCIMAGTAGLAPDGRHVLLFGGASGVLLRISLGLDTSRRGAFLAHHPGFSRDVLRFDPDAGTFAKAGQLHSPHLLPVTTPAVAYRDGIVLASGEVRPGQRSPRVWLVTPGQPSPPPAFGWINWLTLTLYLLAMVAIGWRCARGIHGTEEFFLAGRRIPWWAAGLSIFGTQLSAITFMAIPATSFASDWVRITGNLMILLAIPIVVWFYLPKLLGSGLTTAYEFLGNRFGRGARQIAAGLFVGMQLGRIGIVLYLPSIALAAVTGLNVYACVAAMGILAIVYTALGGIAAVIWTDVVQVIVLLGGAGLALIVAVSGAGGLAEVLDVSEAAGRLRVIQPGLELDAMTLPVMTIGFLFLNLVPYSSDQAVVQRYMTTANPRAAAASLWTNFVLTVPTGLVFFGLGTALFAFYNAHPDLPTPAQNDRIVPWFVVRELPPGVAGIVIAAIFAASMSSLDSAMNSVSTVVVWDFLRPARPELSDAAQLRAGRRMTVLIGVLGIGAAGFMASMEIRFLFDAFNKVLGMFGGPLAAMFFLGVFTRRVQGPAAICGAATGAALVGGLELLRVAAATAWIHPFLFAALGFSTSVVVGLLAQPLLGRTRSPVITNP